MVESTEFYFQVTADAASMSGLHLPSWNGGAMKTLEERDTVPLPVTDKPAFTVGCWEPVLDP